MRKFRMIGFIILVCLVISAIAAFAGEPAGKNKGKYHWLPINGSAPNQRIKVWLEPEQNGIQNEIRVKMPGMAYSALEAEEGTVFDQLHVPGCGMWAEKVGNPNLPFKGFFMEIPYGVEPEVKILEAPRVSLGTGFKVYPKQPPKPNTIGAKKPKFAQNKNDYKKNQFFPQSPVLLDEPVIIRGRRVIFIQVFPVQYNPAKQEIRALTSLRFRLKFKGKIDQAAEIEKRKKTNPFYENMFREILLNYEPCPEIVSGNTKSVSSSSKKDKDAISLSESGQRLLSSSNAADYLIIVKDQFASQVSSTIADWKNKKGFITRVATLSEVGSTPQAIKNYIQNSYDTWDPPPSYVLFVGDSQDIPLYHHTGIYSCDTDQWYACVDGDDFFVDLTIGRIPAHTSEECSVMINKIMTYDRTPDSGSWYNDFLCATYFQDEDNNKRADRWFCEGGMTIYDFLVNDKGWDGHPAIDSRHYANPQYDYHFDTENFDHRAELNQIRWGLTPPQVYPDPVPQWIVDLWESPTAATASVDAALEAGVGLAIHSDHGSEVAWGHPHYTVSDITSLTNGVKTPVLLSFNCLTGSFQYDQGDCFCEAFLKHEEGGAIATVAATRVSFSGLTDLIMHGMMNCFYPDYDPSYKDTTSYPCSRRPAEALSYGKLYYYSWQKVYYGEEGNLHMFNYLGDPELMMRTRTPRTITPLFPEYMPYNKYVDVEVTVIGDGWAVEDALVCISHPSSGEYWKGYTNSQGVVTFSNIRFTSQSDYDIVISGQDCRPFEDTISISLPDECSNAMTIYNGADISLDDYLYYASKSSNPWPSCSSPWYSSKDVWYKFHPGSLKNVSLLMYSDMPGGGFIVYKGSCSSLTLVDCGNGNPMNGSTLNFPTSYDDQNEYYIRVYGLRYSMGILYLDWQDTTNDECMNATSLSNGSSFYFTNQFYNATMSLPPYPECASPESYSVDVWYKIHPGGGKSVSIDYHADMPGSGFVVYSGSCGELVLENCGIYQGGEGHALQFYTLPDDDEDYYLRLYAHRYMLGDLDVDWFTVPPGEMCIIPQPITCGNTFDWSNPIPGSTDDEVPAYTAKGQPGTGHWLELIIPPEKKATVSVCDLDLCQYVAIGFYWECGDVENPFDEICEMEETELSFTNPSLETVKIRVLVNYLIHTYGAEISASCVTAKYGQSCDLPQYAGCGDLFDYQNPIRGTTQDVLPCFQSTGEPATGHWLSVDIPGYKQATVRNWIEEGMMSVGIGFYNSCGSVSSPFDSVCGYGQKTLSYINFKDSQATIKVLANRNIHSLENEIEISCIDVTHGDLCTNARPLECGETVDCFHEIPGKTGDRISCFSVPVGDSNGHWLELTVPAYSSATITLDGGEDEMGVALALYGSCGGAVLSQDCDPNYSQVGYTNNTSQPVTVKILANYCKHVLECNLSVSCN